MIIIIMIIIVIQEALEEENEANHGRPAFCALLPERGPCVMLRTRWGAFHVYDTCAWDDHLIPKHYIVAVTSSENVFNVQILIFTLKPEHEPCSGARTMPQGISSDEKNKNPNKQLVSRYCSHHHHQVSEV